MAAGDGAAERAALADEVGLADELVEVARAHPRGERLPLGRWPEQGFGAGAGWCAPGGHGPMVARAAISRDLKTPVTSISDPEHEQDDEQQDRDPGDVLEVAGDVGVLARVVERGHRGGADLARPSRTAPAIGGGRSGRPAPRRRAAPRAPRRAASSASVRPAGRGAAAAVDAAPDVVDVAGRRVIGLR